MLATAISLPVEKIAKACREHGVAELSAICSVLRDDIRPGKCDAQQEPCLP